MLDQNLATRPGSILNRQGGSIFNRRGHAGLDTPNRVADASDEKLLGIKGVGRVKLKAIREFCASITENRDKDRLDRVLR